MSITESNDSFDCDVTYALFVQDSESNWIAAGTDGSVYDYIHAFDVTTGTLEVNSSDI